MAMQRPFPRETGLERNERLAADRKCNASRHKLAHALSVASPVGWHPSPTVLPPCRDLPGLRFGRADRNWSARTLENSTRVLCTEAEVNALDNPTLLGPCDRATQGNNVTFPGPSRRAQK